MRTITVLVILGASLAGCLSEGPWPWPTPATVVEGTVASLTGSSLEVATKPSGTWVVLGPETRFWRAIKADGKSGQWMIAEGTRTATTLRATRVFVFDAPPEAETSPIPGLLGTNPGISGVITQVDGPRFSALPEGAAQTPVTVALDPARVFLLQPTSYEAVKVGLLVRVVGNSVVILPPADVDPLKGVVHALTTVRDHPLTWESKTLETTSGDTGALIIQGDTDATLKKVRVSTTGASSDVSLSGLQGLNSGLLAEGGGRLVLDYCDVLTTGPGATGVFAQGKGTSVHLTRVKLGVLGDDAPGMVVADGASVSVTGSDLVSRGARAPALVLKSGAVTLVGGSLVTSGPSSPGIDSQGEVSAQGTLVSVQGSEGVRIRGFGAVSLDTVGLTVRGSFPVVAMETEDSSPGQGTLSLVGGTVTASPAQTVVIVEGTSATVDLEHVEWAALGPWLVLRKAQVEAQIRHQRLIGPLIVDQSSAVTLRLRDESRWTGAVRGPGASAGVDLTIDDTSLWVVTGNSEVGGLHVPLQGVLVVGIEGDASVSYDPTKSPELGGQTYAFQHGTGRLFPR